MFPILQELTKVTATEPPRIKVSVETIMYQMAIIHRKAGTAAGAIIILIQMDMEEATTIQIIIRQQAVQVECKDIIKDQIKRLMRELF